MLGFGRQRLAAVPLAALAQHPQNQLRGGGQLVRLPAWPGSAVCAAPAGATRPLGQHLLYRALGLRPGVDELAAGAELA